MSSHQVGSKVGRKTNLKCTTSAGTIGASSAVCSAFAFAIIMTETGARLVAIAATGSVLEAHHGCLLLESSEEWSPEEALGLNLEGDHE